MNKKIRILPDWHNQGSTEGNTAGTIYSRRPGAGGDRARDRRAAEDRAAGGVGSHVPCRLGAAQSRSADQ